MIKLFAVFDVFGSNGEFVCTIFANFASFSFLIIFEIAKIAKLQEIMDFTTIGQWKAPKPSGQSMGGPGYLGGGGGVVRPKIVATLKKYKLATFSDQPRSDA